MKKSISVFLFLSLFGLTCSSKYVTTTIECYVDAIGCAQAVVIENPQYRTFRIISIDTVKHEVRVKLYFDQRSLDMNKFEDK